MTPFPAFPLPLLQDIVSTLIKHKAIVNTTNTNGGTALHIASRYGSLAVAQLLLQSGANMNSRDRNGQSALMSATSFGRIDIALELIKAGANVNFRSAQGDTALIAAASHGHLALVSVLIDKVRTPPISSYISPSMYPSIHLVISFYIYHPSPPSYHFRCPSPLTQGAEPNAQNIHGNSALIWAARGDHFDVCEMLLVKGCADLLATDRLNKVRAADLRAENQGLAGCRGLGRFLSRSHLFSSLLLVPSSPPSQTALDLYGLNAFRSRLSKKDKVPIAGRGKP